MVVRLKSNTAAIDRDNGCPWIYIVWTSNDPYSVGPEFIGCSGGQRETEISVG